MSGHTCRLPVCPACKETQRALVSDAYHKGVREALDHSEAATQCMRDLVLRLKAALCEALGAWESYDEFRVDSARRESLRALIVPTESNSEEVKR